eukprot:2583322-Pleurochrysis_carterae.AAC.3
MSAAVARVDSTRVVAVALFDKIVVVVGVQAVVLGCCGSGDCACGGRGVGSSCGEGGSGRVDNFGGKTG